MTNLSLQIRCTNLVCLNLTDHGKYFLYIVMFVYYSKVCLFVIIMLRYLLVIIILYNEVTFL